ncbi:hypothetical protein WR25_26801 [Diploscapter pachys]|uniref:Uncharacterized protein n=1 Tax=Diploscapter pachys TaxID=2018661 RepID=A0A2A2KKZ1_9BILA|nr:hypothetical protein WR25_26801 [Diploscapter pachys]
MIRMRTKIIPKSKKAEPYRPPTQPRQTTRQVGGYFEAPAHPAVPEICWDFNAILAKRIVDGKVQYLIDLRPTWVDVGQIVPEDKSPDQMLAESEQMMGMYPSGPPSTPSNTPLFSNPNVYGGNAAMGFTNMPIWNMNPAMLQHSQLPCFPFNPAAPQPHPIHRTPELRINRIAKFTQSQHEVRNLWWYSLLDNCELKVAVKNF